MPCLRSHSVSTIDLRALTEEDKDQSSVWEVEANGKIELLNDSAKRTQNSFYYGHSG